MRRGLSVSEYGIAEVETRRGARVRDRGGGLRVPRLRVDPARAARERRRARGRARAASCRSSSSSATCAATCTRTRRGRTARTRSRRWSRRAVEKGYEYYAICDHSQRLRDGRLAQQAAAIDALERSSVPLTHPEGDRGEHPRRRRARRRRRGARDARLGRRVGALELRQGPDRARARGDGEPVRRLHRPPDEPQDRQARAGRRSTSSA